GAVGTTSRCGRLPPTAPLAAPCHRLPSLGHHGRAVRPFRQAEVGQGARACSRFYGRPEEGLAVGGEGYSPGRSRVLALRKATLRRALGPTAGRAPVRACDGGG